MKLSIIIVNFNAIHFLDLCLDAVFKAVANVDAEIIVVDNASVDNSCAMVREFYPQAILIESQTNLGFAKGNNLAVNRASGDVILFLNPDTVVGVGTFEKVIAHFENNQHTGAIGVKMIDGSGNFLKESKRGLPTPFVAFCKFSGLSSLFSTSKYIAKYYEGHIPENQTASVAVLAGAFMAMRKKTIEKVGSLDEDYFMFGEDIDLSYRVTLGGYQNVYLPEIVIIHFKGESTVKSDISYLNNFFGTMELFYKKHFAKKYPFFVFWMIHVAIKAMILLKSRQKTKPIQLELPQEGKTYFLTTDSSVCLQCEKLLGYKPIIINDIRKLSHLPEQGLANLIVDASVDRSMVVNALDNRLLTNVLTWFYTPKTNALIGSFSGNTKGAVWV